MLWKQKQAMAWAGRIELWVHGKGWPKEEGPYIRTRAAGGGCSWEAHWHQRRWGHICTSHRLRPLSPSTSRSSSVHSWRPGIKEGKRVDDDHGGDIQNEGPSNHESSWPKLHSDPPRHKTPSPAQTPSTLPPGSPILDHSLPSSQNDHWGRMAAAAND